MRWGCRRAPDRQATMATTITQPRCGRPGTHAKKGGVIIRRGHDGHRTRPRIVSFHKWPQLSVPTRPAAAQQATRGDIPQKREPLGGEHDAEGRLVAGWRVPPSG
jgi:hypothetical protein